MRTTLSALAGILLLASCAQTPLDWVNPFIGTEFNGHTFPGAAYPLGMVQPGPETGRTSWDYCSGYRFADTTLLGFSQDRLNGTGCSDLGDILVMPFGTLPKDDFSSTMDKSTEIATPGYYSIYLPGNKVKAEMTCTPHTGFYKFKYDETSRGVYIDFDTIIGGGKVLDSDIKAVNGTDIEGSLEIRAWVHRTLYFAIRFDTPVREFTIRKKSEEAKASQYLMSFSDSDKPVKMKISLSTVSTEGAWGNMNDELPHWNFGRAHKAARQEWSKYLTLGTIEGSDDQKTTFYTCLYHLFLQPADIADTDGRYNGADDKVHTASAGSHYSTLSQWDTFRAANPFYSLLTPDFAGDLAVSMIEQCDEQGFLPIWALCGKENFCMIGNHAVPPVVDAALNGFKGVDPEKAYEAVRKSLTTPHPKSDWENYDRYGYLPCDLGQRESVSRTMEMGYDDWCAALLAEKLGKDEDAAFFRNRAGYFKNMIDPETRLARGRRADGTWREPFFPFSYAHNETVGGDYTEGNAWHYTWHAMQDIPGLIEVLGGKDAFVGKLDTLFVLQPGEELTGKLPDVTGLIGQYAHGNEPSHHVAYLYAMAGRPDRTAEVVRQVFDQFYLPKPDGLCGNDDCGQMSAWYLFSACGFYPVNPISGEFVFGAPQIPQITLRLPDGGTFKIVAEGLDEVHKYVESITLNGKDIEGCITREQILKGGELHFVMTDKI